MSTEIRDVIIIWKGTGAVWTRLPGGSYVAGCVHIRTSRGSSASSSSAGTPVAGHDPAPGGRSRPRIADSWPIDHSSGWWACRWGIVSARSAPTGGPTRSRASWVPSFHPRFPALAKHAAGARLLFWFGCKVADHGSCTSGRETPCRKPADLIGPPDSCWGLARGGPTSRRMSRSLSLGESSARECLVFTWRTARPRVRGGRDGGCCSHGPATTRSAGGHHPGGLLGFVLGGSVAGGARPSGGVPGGSGGAAGPRHRPSIEARHHRVARNLGAALRAHSSWRWENAMVRTLHTGVARSAASLQLGGSSMLLAPRPKLASAAGRDRRPPHRAVALAARWIDPAIRSGRLPPP